MAEQFIAHLRAQAFDDLDASGHAVDLQGWVNAGFDQCLDQVCAHMARAPGGLFIEVGSWKGRSACRIADAFKARGVGASALLCVDTWLGAPEFWTWGLHEDQRGKSLARRSGYPSVFYTFTRNVKALGHHDLIVPFPLSSGQAADVLRHYGVRARAIYVDGAHEYKAVLADLETFDALLEPGGLLWGDDYDWPGVRQAVEEYAAARGRQLRVVGQNWLLARAAA